MADNSIKRAIMAVQLDNRIVEAAQVQKTFTEHGCIIRMRLGMHPGVQSECSVEGLIILDLSGTSTEIGKLEADLNGIKGVQSSHMLVPAMVTSTKA